MSGSEIGVVPTEAYEYTKCSVCFLTIPDGMMHGTTIDCVNALKRRLSTMWADPGSPGVALEHHLAEMDRSRREGRAEAESKEPFFSDAILAHNAAQSALMMAYGIVEGMMAKGGPHENDSVLAIAKSRLDRLKSVFTVSTMIDVDCPSCQKSLPHAHVPPVNQVLLQKLDYADKIREAIAAVIGEDGPPKCPKCGSEKGGLGTSGAYFICQGECKGEVYWTVGHVPPLRWVDAVRSSPWGKKEAIDSILTIQILELQGALREEKIYSRRAEKPTPGKKRFAPGDHIILPTKEAGPGLYREYVVTRTGSPGMSTYHLIHPDQEDTLEAVMPFDAMTVDRTAQRLFVEQ